ncbi:rhomboid family intramembrane serine protease [Roseibium litorale]|uniref:Rhomboid family intramembrane serine protease n=1 Tax=Roseibium litorale TaxID=2803841 RepID=A0ABR9CKU8_9HYPH|nr:rhomboid family intramembrane serine protease [Roseibium litorale]MBD8890952.1 rhomboid family intramembrane serine protease [Roseibium litorale]
MRSHHPFPVAVLCLAVVTAVASLAVSYLDDGNALSTVQISALRRFGGTTFEDLANLEIWRLVSAQLIHAKNEHMMYNAVCLLLVGGLLESRIGALRVLVIWLVAGGLATLISPILIPAPWNVGTGASQGVFALSASAAVLVMSGEISGKFGWPFIAFALVPAQALDLLSAGYPKPGHVSALFLGLMFGLLFKNRSTLPSDTA